MCFGLRPPSTHPNPNLRTYGVSTYGTYIFDFFQSMAPQAPEMHLRSSVSVQNVFVADRITPIIIFSVRCESDSQWLSAGRDTVSRRIYFSVRCESLSIRFLVRCKLDSVLDRSRRILSPYVVNLILFGSRNIVSIPILCRSN